MRQRTVKLMRRVARLGGANPKESVKQFKKDLPLQPLSHKIWGLITKELRWRERELLGVKLAAAMSPSGELEKAWEEFVEGGK